MAQTASGTQSKIRAYVTDARDLQHDPMDVDASGTEARLEQTVQALQARVLQQQAALEKIRLQADIELGDAVRASQHPREKLRQVLAVKDAYSQLKSTTTFLPSHASALPALLAARTLQHSVHGTKEAIASTEVRLSQTEAILRREEASLHDTGLLTQALERRIGRLRTQREDRSLKSPAQLAKDLIAAKRAQKQSSDAEMQRIGEAINDFIDNYLSGMIAAEELGGPVVGDILHVQDDTLASGFTKQGRPKASKKPASEKSRQRRIDQIWGNKAAVEQGDEPPTEAEAADAELRKLIEHLFTVLTGPGGGKAYHQLERDSAASRFLVRVKIAQFYPKDATKLRLIDFGRELED